MFIRRSKRFVFTFFSSLFVHFNGPENDCFSSSSRDVQIRSCNRKSGPITWFQIQLGLGYINKYICIYIFIAIFF